LPKTVQDVGDVLGNVAQVALVHAHGELDGRLNVVVSDLGGDLHPVHAHDVSHRHRSILNGARNGNIQHRVDRGDVFLEVRDPHVVLVLADGVDPEVTLIELDARVQ